MAETSPDMVAREAAIMARGVGVQNLQSALGIVAILLFAWAISDNRRAVSWRRALGGVAITFALAVIFLKIPPVRAAFASLNGVIAGIAAATRAGTAFVFGYI